MTDQPTRPTPDEVEARILADRWYVHPDDLIGGTAVMNVDKPPSEADWRIGEYEVAGFLSPASARHIAALHNANLDDPLTERLHVAETALVLYGRCGMYRDSDGSQAAVQAWMDWASRYAKDSPEVSEEQAAEYTRRRTEIRKQALARLRPAAAALVARRAEALPLRLHQPNKPSIYLPPELVGCCQECDEPFPCPAVTEAAYAPEAPTDAH